jgi:antirestriction protein ArdC
MVPRTRRWGRSTGAISRGASGCKLCHGRTRGPNSASLLCADLEIRSEPRADDTAYLSSWLKVLRSDRRAIFTAASKAQEAANYLKRFAAVAQERAW